MRSVKVAIEFGMGSSFGLYPSDKKYENEKVYTQKEFLGWEPKRWEEAYILQKEPNRSKARTVKVKKAESKRGALVLWDIENVNFKKDGAVVNRLLRELGFGEAVKFVCFRDRHKKRATEYFMHPSNPEYRVVKLRKLGWRVVSASLSADSMIERIYKEYRQKIDSMLLISADSDFRGICKEAKRLGIRTVVANNHRRSEGELPTPTIISKERKRWLYERFGSLILWVVWA